MKFSLKELLKLLGPYKGYDEFLNTRGSDRYGVSRQRAVIRKGKIHFLKWLEVNHERQTN